MFAKMTLLVAGFMVSSPLIAQPALQAAVQPKPAKDPNRIICERMEETGSRLGGKKVCMTAAEWVAHRQVNRELTDHMQQQQTDQ